MTRTYGKNYDKTLNIKEIAKIVRATIRKDYPDYKFSVRIKRFSGGQSISVKLVDLADNLPLFNPLLDNLTGEAFINLWHNWPKRIAPEINEIFSKINALLNSYNHDGSDIMTDYFDVNFYSDVSIDWKLEQARDELKGFSTKIQKYYEEQAQSSA